MTGAQQGDSQDQCGGARAGPDDEFKMGHGVRIVVRNDVYG
jgi:hypothetical protein